MTSPALLLATHCVADRMSESLFDFATTRTIFAPGATACAHVTSSVVSAAQQNALLGLVGDGAPSGYTTWRLVAGSPKYALKSDVSATIADEPYASMMTIVRPVPSKPF